MKMNTQQLINIAAEFMTYTGRQAYFAKKHGLSVSFVNKLANLRCDILCRKQDWLEQDLKDGRITKQMYTIGSTAISLLFPHQLIQSDVQGYIFENLKRRDAYEKSNQHHPGDADGCGNGRDGGTLRPCDPEG